MDISVQFYEFVMLTTALSVACSLLLIQLQHKKISTRNWMNWYALSHRKCGQFHPCLHKKFEKFEMISIPTGSWIRWLLRARSIPTPPSGSKSSRIFQKFYANRAGTVHTFDGTEYVGCRSHRLMGPCQGNGCRRWDPG